MTQTGNKYHARIQNSVRGGVINPFFKSSNYFTEGRPDHSREAIGPRPTVSRGGSVSVVLSIGYR